MNRYYVETTVAVSADSPEDALRAGLLALAPENVLVASVETALGDVIVYQAVVNADPPRFARHNDVVRRYHGKPGQLREVVL